MKNITRSVLLAVTWVAVSCLAGCQGYRLPIGPPGTINEQRNRATIHDPFPQTEIGPDVVGGRPPQYDRPLPEAEREPLYRDFYGVR